MIFHQIHSRRYLDKLPENTIMARYTSGVELMMLEGNKRTWNAGNITPRLGLPLLIYSQKNNRYWWRTLEKEHDISRYRDFIKQGILYIHFDDIWKPRIIEERDQEGMSYKDYNYIRELILVRDILLKKDQELGVKTKLRAIEIEINNTKNKKQ